MNIDSLVDKMQGGQARGKKLSSNFISFKCETVENPRTNTGPGLNIQGISTLLFLFLFQRCKDIYIPICRKFLWIGVFVSEKRIRWLCLSIIKIRLFKVLTGNDYKSEKQREEKKREYSASLIILQSYTLQVLYTLERSCSAQPFGQIKCLYFKSNPKSLKIQESTFYSYIKNSIQNIFQQRKKLAK